MQSVICNTVLPVKSSHGSQRPEIVPCLFFSDFKLWTMYSFESFADLLTTNLHCCSEFAIYLQKWFRISLSTMRISIFLPLYTYFSIQNFSKSQRSFSRIRKLFNKSDYTHQFRLPQLISITNDTER